MRESFVPIRAVPDSRSLMIASVGGLEPPDLLPERDDSSSFRSHSPVLG
jgi:hypothetical protein